MPVNVLFTNMSCDDLAEHERYHLGDLVSRLHYFSSAEFEKEDHIVALDGDKIVGIVGLQMSPYEDDLLWFKHVSVDPDYRHMGIGTELTTRAVQYAQQHNYELKFSDFENEGIYLLVKQLSNRYPDVKMVTTDEQPICA